MVAERVHKNDLPEMLRPLLERYRDQRHEGETLGDFIDRQDGPVVVPPPPPVRPPRPDVPAAAAVAAAATPTAGADAEEAA